MGGWAGWAGAGRAGRGGGCWVTRSGLDRPGGGGREGRGACRCYGNVGNVSEKSQTFQGKERARGKNMWAKEEGVMAKKEGAWAKNAFCRQKVNICQTYSDNLQPVQFCSVYRNRACIWEVVGNRENPTFAEKYTTIQILWKT